MTAQREEFGCRRGEEDVALGSDEHEPRHDHGLDQVAVDDEPHFDRVGRESQDVRERANFFEEKIQKCALKESKF